MCLVVTTTQLPLRAVAGLALGLPPPPALAEALMCPAAVRPSVWMAAEVDAQSRGRRAGEGPMLVRGQR